MKILFVGFNRIYLNRTMRAQLRSIMAKHDVSLYGPGYIDEAALEKGPWKWADEHGPFDLILFDSYVAEFNTVAARAQPFTLDYLTFSTSQFYKYGAVLKEFVTSYHAKRVFIANIDTYAVSESWANEIMEHGWFVVDGLLAQFTVAEKQELFYIRTRSSDVTHFVGEKGTDHWLNLTKQIPERIISIPHTIGMEQTAFTPTSSRKERFVVPGAGYAERKELYSLLSTTNKRTKLINRLRDKIYHKTHNSLTATKLQELRSRYDEEIATACMAFTSGSFYLTPVRKYFEIPALGTVPIGHVCEGFAELGFVDGKNFIIADSRQEVVDLIASADDDKLQRIASNARQFVLGTHSEIARAEQFAETLKRICDGTFRGSFWKDGTYQHVE